MRAFWIYVFGAQGWGGGSIRERVREFYINKFIFPASDAAQWGEDLEEQLNQVPQGTCQ